MGARHPLSPVIRLGFKHPRKNKSEVIRSLIENISTKMEIALIVEFLLKTDIGYPKDARVAIHPSHPGFIVDTLKYCFFI